MFEGRVIRTVRKINGRAGESLGDRDEACICNHEESVRKIDGRAGVSLGDRNEQAEGLG